MNQAMQVLTSHASVEWYTPCWLADLSRRMLGHIDIDPASCAKANETVKANEYFDANDDGLAQYWRGRVFLNPPYSKVNGRSAQEVWSQKLVEEFEAGRVTCAILLVKAALGYKWFEVLFEEWPVCFLRERVYFVREDGFCGQDKRATAVFYFGPDVKFFKTTFQHYGRVILPHE
jgi:ParB family chromosome partitioning protein